MPAPELRTSSDDGSGIGAMFGLAGPDVATVEDICKQAFAERGISGEAFFERLQRGMPLDAALGFPTELREVLYARAHRWFSIGRYGKAEELFRALCVASPGDADYWVGLAICQRLSDDLPAARLALQTALRLRPDWAVPRFHACELALRQDRFEEATAHLAAFERLADAETPSAMSAEAARLAAAIAVRGAAVQGAAR